MYFGVPVWPITWSPPYDETIKRIAEQGYKGIELIGWRRDALDNYYTDETIAGLNKLISGLGMHVTNFNHTPEGITSMDPAVREEKKGDFKRAIDIAAALGSKNVTMVAPFPFGYKHTDFPELRHIAEFQQWSYSHVNVNYDWDENFQQFVETLKELCAYAKQYDLWILLEAHPYRMVNSAASMLRLIDHVGADNLGFNFDPSHLFPQGDMPEWAVHMLKGRIRHTHFSDNDTLTNVHWRPGQGKINWKAVMQALHDIGYEGTINFELEDIPGAATPTSAMQDDDINNEMEEQMAMARKYITEICEELQIPLAD